MSTKLCEGQIDISLAYDNVSVISVTSDEKRCVMSVTGDPITVRNSLVDLFVLFQQKPQGIAILRDALIIAEKQRREMLEIENRKKGIIKPRIVN